MLFLTATCIGFATGALRSVLSLALVATLILFVFGGAALVSAGPVSLLSLGIAIAGYNVGVMALMGAVFAFDGRRQTA
ncbi:hypothetical protein [Rhizobium straminoryzae]|uniref:Uncharacterized protein n=1 Tax=Rhizobium straminoryzae TaxID=1387186 RepID=A0A549T8V8_9HYPH|nr:hypothetical protein [Rhizobium straminoryzae]TRL38290.1 hypothetical protein FNA46_13185 [Rhizobium straminoryzae]